MILTLAQICSSATALVQNRTDIPLSECSYWANLAYQEVATTLKAFGQEAIAVSSTTSGENKISLPSDFAYAVSVSNTSGFLWDTPMRQVEASEFDSQSTILGWPDQYALYASWMELWPSPDSSYSIQLRYRTKLTSLVSSTDTPVLDDRWHLGIVYKTAAMIAAVRNDLESESMNNNRYVRYMDSRPTDQGYRQQDKSGMRVSMAWRGR